MPFLTINSHRLEYEWIRVTPETRPPIVMLHEGLGSLAMWKDFPRRVAQATAHNVMVYSRLGYGQSDPITGPRPVRFMHDEALDTLPKILDALEIERPVLLGHSDGGSIALIYAGGSGQPVAGLILMAPHVMVEEITLASIAAARTTYQTTNLRARLAPYHADVDGAFWGWNDVWLHPDFRYWNIEEYLPAITCPVLAIQGENDQYGTMEQIDRIARQVSGPVELLKLPDCGHSPHRDQPQAVLEAITRFMAHLAGRQET